MSYCVYSLSNRKTGSFSIELEPFTASSPRAASPEDSVFCLALCPNLESARENLNFYKNLYKIS